MLTLLWKDWLSILKCLMLIVIKSLNLLDVCEIKTEFERFFAFSHLRLDNKKSQQNILLNTGLSVEDVFVIYVSAIMKICWVPCFFPQKYENRDYSCWFQSSKQHQKLLEWEFDTPLQQSLLSNNKTCLYKQQYLFSKCISIFSRTIWVILRCWGNSSILCQQNSDAL